MLSTHNREKILRLFFADPVKKEGFQLREISRKIELAPVSVKRYLLELEQENLIRKEIIRERPTYYANRDEDYFKTLKSLDTMRMLKETGLISYIEEKILPDAIILFGSCPRGEDTLGSDIDLFVVSSEKDLELESYENRLSRKINIFFCKDFNKLSKELKNNVLNGVILSGYLKVF